MNLIDTGALIDIQRNHPPRSRLVFDAKVTTERTRICRHGTDSGCTKFAKVRDIHRLLSPLGVVWPNEADCGRALSLFSVYHFSDGLGLIDALIAATAIVLGAELLTFNAKHYRAVPGLILRQPYKR